MKKNCWEHNNCGREQNGIKVDALGVCPAASDDRLDGVHGGKKSGRACWMIPGTLCGGKVHGTYSMKSMTCETCDFYLLTKQEEGTNFQFAVFLRNKLKRTLCPV